MEVVIAIGSLALWLLAFWYLYVLVMGLYRAYLSGHLKGFPLWLSAPALITGYLVDLISNWTIATVVFWEFPNRPLELVTDRLTRYIKKDSAWRGNLATMVCVSLLDFFDPSGKHCQ